MYTAVYNMEFYFIIQCSAPFVGNGKLCGKDSDADGYPDMQLNCNDSYCVQVSMFTYDLCKVVNT